MSKYRDLEIVCKDCNGTGTKSVGMPPAPGDQCLDCAGTGYKIWGRIKFKNADLPPDE